jgi:hypothetical protein
MRCILASMLLASSFTASAAFVDLDKPGVLDRIEQENPEHHALIVAALEKARTLDCDGAARLFRARGERGHFTCPGAMVMLSYPPKKRFTLTLGDVTYASNVALAVRLPYAAR